MNQFSLKRSAFADDFIFGTATAAYQIEGSSNGQCGSSHWDTFAATPGNVLNADNGSMACDHYHRYPQDLDLIKRGGFDAYRFSTSWARVMPDGKDINKEGLEFYDRLVDAICERNLKPYLTLYHWDLPSPLADHGGWMNRDTTERFCDYALTVSQKIGDRVAAITTLNEPWCISWLSHFMGVHAPGLRDIRATARAMHHTLLAHGKACAALKSAGHKNVGIVLNLNYSQAASDSEADRVAAYTNDGIVNRWYLDALFHGQYPEDILQALQPHMPEAYEEDLQTIQTPMDYLGINYYTRSLHSKDADTPWPASKAEEGTLPKTQMGWEIYPDGLDKILQRVEKEYSRGLPLFVTENGMAWADEVQSGAVQDSERVDYISEHLSAIKSAVDAGVNLQGYFYWSLLDNFEWGFGYEKRFGLVHVDYQSQLRMPKASYHAWQQFLTGLG